MTNAKFNVNAQFTLHLSNFVFKYHMPVIKIDTLLRIPKVRQNRHNTKVSIIHIYIYIYLTAQRRKHAHYDTSGCLDSELSIKYDLAKPKIYNRKQAGYGN